MFFTHRAKGIALAAIAVALLATACSQQEIAQREAQNKAADRRAYVQQNDVEFENYNRRQQLTDDPSTIIWCTSAYPFPGTPLFTVPVVGKLTSGGKRPFPNDPGPDGMYGSSGEYRYGFTTAGTMVDFYNIATFCTTEPTVWQRENTEIVMKIDPVLAKAQADAKEALKRGDTATATSILESAIGKSQ